MYERTNLKNSDSTEALRYKTDFAVKKIDLSELVFSLDVSPKKRNLDWMREIRVEKAAEIDKKK